jgi:hypothetical protein
VKEASGAWQKSSGRKNEPLFSVEGIVSVDPGCHHGSSE